MSFTVPRNAPSFNNPQRVIEDHIWGSTAVARGPNSRAGAGGGILNGVQDRLFENRNALPMYKDKPYAYPPSYRRRPLWRRKRSFGFVLLVISLLYYFGAFEKRRDNAVSWSWLSSSSESGRADWLGRRQRVVEAFTLSFDAYSRYAWGYDEYHPVSRKGKQMAPGGMGWIIVDALDTMILMNLTSSVAHARNWIANSLTYDQDQDVSTFETTIRMLGGLLSAHYLSNEYPDLAPMADDDAGAPGEDLYLEKARDLADRLVVAFDTASGIPFASVNIGSYKGIPAHDNSAASSTAEATTLQLEFKYLAKLTGEKEFWDKAEKVMEIVDGNAPKGGLVPIFIRVATGEFYGQNIRLGSRGDSYYEYLIKQYLQTNKQEPLYLDMWDESLQGVRDHLITYTEPSEFTIIGERQTGLDGPLTPKMDHLVCFMPGTIALAATGGLTEAEAKKRGTWTKKNEEDMQLARELMQTCWGMYKYMATGLAAEITYFNVSDPPLPESAPHQAPDVLDADPEAEWRKAFKVHDLDVHNLQRPETVESLFYMWRITGDIKYREWGWEMFKSFMAYTAVPEGGGFTSLSDANKIPPVVRDNMESFWLMNMFPMKEDSLGHTNSYNAMREPLYEDVAPPSFLDKFIDGFRRDPNQRITPNDPFDETHAAEATQLFRPMLSRNGPHAHYYDLRLANQQTAETHLARKLKGRHLQMIAIGGSIGTGLFVSSGRALESGGPASVLLSYLIVGVMLYCTVQALGELTVSFPVAGSFSSYSTRFLHPSWGFAMGWNYALQWLVALPLEIISASIVTTYWNSSLNKAIFVTIFLLAIVVINLCGVEGYGEAEFLFAIIKIIAVIAFILLGIVLNIGGVPGGGYIGGQYWHDPGAFNNGFKGLCSVFVTAAFSFSGTELVGLAAAETANPRKSLPAAIKQVFWRITLFYLVALTLVGLLVPYNEKKLLNDKDMPTMASPFVIAIENARIDVLPSVMNAVILISVLSVGNSSVFGSSRTLAALADQNQAPTILSYVDRRGRPLVAIMVASAVGLLAYLANLKQEEEVLDWLVAISGLSSILTWGSICLAHIRFRKAWACNGHKVSELAFKSQVGVLGSWLGLTINGLILIAQFWVGAWPVDYMQKTPLQLAKSVFLVFLGVPVVSLFFVVHYFWHRTSIVRVADMDVDTGRRDFHLPILLAQERGEKQSWPRWKRVYKCLC
ncbi:amino acid permease [Xylaria intraflava]|nr:amino acid permease [Xylaria intraflava]